MAYVLSRQTAAGLKELLAERGKRQPRALLDRDGEVEEAGPYYAPWSLIWHRNQGTGDSVQTGWYVKYHADYISAPQGVSEAVGALFTTGVALDTDTNHKWYKVPSQTLPDINANQAYSRRDLAMYIHKTSSSSGETWSAQWVNAKPSGFDADNDFYMPVATIDSQGLPNGGIRVTQRECGTMALSKGGGGGGGEGVYVDVITSIDSVTVESVTGGAYVLRVNYGKKRLKVVQDATATAGTADLTLMAQAVVNNTSYDPEYGNFKQVKRTFVMLPTVGQDAESTVFTAVAHPASP